MIRQLRNSRAAFGLLMMSTLLASAPAWAQANVVLENLTADSEKSTVAIKRIELVGTNLTQDEAKKLFSSATRQEAADLLAKFEAKQILIPETIVRQKDNQGGVTLRDFQANDVNKGKAARLSLAGVDGDGVTDKGEKIGIKAGAVTVDNLDMAAAIAALKGADPMQGLTRASRISSNGFELTAPDKDTPATAPGGNIIKFSLGSLSVEQSYDGDAPTRSSVALNGIGVELPKASTGGAQLAAQGLDRLLANLHFGGAYDPARRSYTLDDFSLDADKIGSLRLRAELGGVDRQAFSGSSQQRIAAFMGADASMLELRFVNAGVFEKVVAHFAKEQNKAPAALLAEWKAMAGVLPQMLLPGQDAGVKAGQAVGAFIDNPRSLTVSVKSKGTPLKMLELAGIKDPAAFLAKVNVEFFTEGAAGAPKAASAPAGAPGVGWGAGQSAPAAAPAQKQAAVAPSGKLAGAAAWSALVGNTIAGKDSDGDPLFEMYSADGKLKQLDDDVVTSGKWVLRGQKVCILYSNEKEESCYDVEVFGDTATFTDEDGEGQRYKILQGNPKGL